MHKFTLVDGHRTKLQAQTKKLQHALYKWCYSTKQELILQGGRFLLSNNVDNLRVPQLDILCCLDEYATLAKLTLFPPPLRHPRMHELPTLQNLCSPTMITQCFHEHLCPLFSSSVVLLLVSPLSSLFALSSSLSSLVSPLSFFSRSRVAQLVASLCVI